MGYRAVESRRLRIARVLRDAWIAGTLCLLTPVAAAYARSNPQPASWSAESLASEARLDSVARRLAAGNIERCESAPSNGALAAITGCGGRFIVVPGSRCNAWADGRNVYVSARLMRRAARDDELAFVVAHEASHNILHHAEELKVLGNNQFSGLDRAAAERVRQTEIEADILATELLARAGFDPRRSEAFLRRTMPRANTGRNATHPDLATRIAIINKQSRNISIYTNPAGRIGAFAGP